MNVKIVIKNKAYGGKVLWDYWVFEDEDYLVGEGLRFTSPEIALKYAIGDMKDAEEESIFEDEDEED